MTEPPAADSLDYNLIAKGFLSIVSDTEIDESTLKQSLLSKLTKVRER